MSIFDQYISVYNGVTDNVGTYTLLSNFLGSKRHIGRILDLRAETDEVRKKAIKLSLPMATVSGWFASPRKVENLQRHSGFLCIDIDGKDNPAWSVEDMKQVLSLREEVAYAAMSVGGNGAFAILPLAYPERHEEQFDAIREEFLTDYDLKLDKSCRDVTRLRALSYDPDPYINEQAMRYEGLYTYTPTLAAPSLTGASGDLIKVKRCVEMIEQYGIDITGNYDDWVRIGASLASLGEEGRYYFHKVSSMYPDYKYQETDRKFTALLRVPRRSGLGNFFFWCKQHGITYKKEQ